jgi:hypothetical protein
MDVIYHLGAHCTDDGLLVGTLLKNRARLAEEEVVIGSPGRFRTPLREVLQMLDGAEAGPELQETLLDTITDQDRIGRLVLSNENFMGVAPRAVGEGRFYPLAGARAAGLRALFPQAGCEFFLAIRNPAAFLPAVLAQLRDPDYERFMEGTDPHGLRWSDVVAQLRAGAPDAGVTVWCDEDTPLIWPEVLRAVAGVGPGVPLSGEDGRLAEALTPQGLSSLSGYLAANPAPTVTHRRRVTSVFLEKFPADAAVQEEFDLPEWTEGHVERLGAAYEADMAVIGAMEGVRFLVP